jgi:hypothetical protein
LLLSISSYFLSDVFIDFSFTECFFSEVITGLGLGDGDGETAKDDLEDGLIGDVDTLFLFVNLVINKSNKDTAAAVKIK